MDQKKIGGFLKELRKEKGITQEQFAEMMGVSGRTVSRWETGTNMPDLSILIQIADYYNVEMKEILDGERKSEIMEKELKETLMKVADYSEIEKEKAAKAGNTAFGIMFAICTAMIVIQLAITGDLLFTMGETAALVIGGVAYIFIMIHNGIWETGSKIKSTPFSDAVISAVCSGAFTAIYVLFLSSKTSAEDQMIAHAALLFFVGIAILSFVVLRLLAFLSNRRKTTLEMTKDETKDKTKAISQNHDIQPVFVFVADGNMQADMVVEALKRNDIAAYKQDLGNAGFNSVRCGMGRIGDDRVAVYVAGDKVDDAIQVLHGMGLEIS